MGQRIEYPLLWLSDPSLNSRPVSLWWLLSVLNLPSTDHAPRICFRPITDLVEFVKRKELWRLFLKGNQRPQGGRYSKSNIT